MTCSKTIPNTVIACGEGGNYCPEGCQDEALDALRDDVEQLLAFIDRTPRDAVFANDMYELTLAVARTLVAERWARKAGR